MSTPLTEDERLLAFSIWQELREGNSKAQAHLSDAPEIVRNAILMQLVDAMNRRKAEGKPVNAPNPFELIEEDKSSCVK